MFSVQDTFAPLNNGKFKVGLGGILGRGHFARGCEEKKVCAMLTPRELGSCNCRLLAPLVKATRGSYMTQALAEARMYTEMCGEASGFWRLVPKYYGGVCFRLPD